jgi:hypothetical protein
MPDDTEPLCVACSPGRNVFDAFTMLLIGRQEAEMEFTIIELAALILISLWGLVAMGKLLQRLSAIGRTLQEIKLVLQEGRNEAGR